MVFDKRARRACPLSRQGSWAHGVGLGAIALSLSLALSLAACEGCRSTGAPPGPAASSGHAGGADASVDPGTPTLRFYLVSDLAGALEPCGCTKDQLGGLDHLAAYLRAQAGKAQASALLAAGPLFFMDPALNGDRAAQDIAKAETIAASLKTLGFAAFAPGANDFCGGAAELAKLGGLSGGAIAIANASPFTPPPDSDAGADAGSARAADLATAPLVLRDMNGIKVAIVGVTMADVRALDAVVKPAIPLSMDPPTPPLKARAAEAKAAGAKVILALAAVGRGEAKRIADALPELTAILVGSVGGSGDLNNTAPPPERVGGVIIAETGNHLTTVGVLDLFVKDGSFQFADATGLELGRKREELLRRIDELHVKIAAWERDPAIAEGDLTARRAELTKLEGEKASLDAPRPPGQGSFFRYTLEEVRSSLGRWDPLESTCRHASLSIL